MRRPDDSLTTLVIKQTGMKKRPYRVAPDKGGGTPVNDAFAWDVGDLAKFALLRQLCVAAGDGFRLGAVWCYTRTPPRTGHGRHIAYLDNGHAYGESVRARDAILYDLMRRGLTARRSILSAQYRAVLPPNTTHVDAPFVGERRARPAYWQSALAATSAAAVVFFDPDNGIGPGSGPLTVTYGELAAFYGRGQSLVIYQHQNRAKGGIVRVARDRVLALRRHIGASDVAVLRWHRYQARLFFIVPAPGHRDVLAAGVRALLASPWGSVARRGQPDFSELVIGPL